MLNQRAKDLCFLAISKASLPNYFYRKLIYWRASSIKRPLHLHLGSGPKYLPGFVNIDGNPRQKIDLWLDVRNGLPFPDNSAESIYTTHMFEHFYADELEELLKECVRVLKPGGGMRIVVPNLNNAILAYQQKWANWFYDSFPRHFDSLGGRFSNFVFCDGQHRTAFDFGYLEEVLCQAGFTEVEEWVEGKSRLYRNDAPVYEPTEAGKLPHSLFVEAFK